MTRVVVTGGSGKLGRACVRDLVEHGYDVRQRRPRPLAATRARRSWPSTSRTWARCCSCSARSTSTTTGVDAVVHLAAIPAPGMTPNATVFRLNTVSTYNVFEAARHLGIRNVVWASSETLLGLPLDTPPPAIPIDEEYAAAARRPPTRSPS